MHLVAADLQVFPWPNIEPTQIIFGNRAEEFLSVLAKNQQGFTLKQKVWNKKPQLINQEISKHNFASSVHECGDQHIVHI